MRLIFPLLAFAALTACTSGEKGDSGGGDSASDSATDTGDSAPPDADADGSPDDEDCVDNDGAIHPGAPEVCNDLDDDCDSLVDAADDDLTDGTTWFVDGDADGYGGPTTTVACAPGEGLAADSSDCDDTDAAVNIDGVESCNGHDDDCDGLVDADDPQLVSFPIWYPDRDGDTYGDSDDGVAGCTGPEGYIAQGDDCDDRDEQVHPNADEVCNGVDDDCDGDTDDEDAIIVEGNTFYQDLDGDGHGTAAATTTGCDPMSGWGVWDDDCDDGAPSVYPGALESCNDADDNCNGDVDEAPTRDGTTWFPDADGDTYGAEAGRLNSCEQPPGYVTNNEDCDDTDAAVGGGCGGLISDATELYFEYDWSPGGAYDGSSDWFLQTDGSWYSVSEGFTGVWTWDSATLTVEIIYDTGTIYIGTTTDRVNFTGTMASGAGIWQGYLSP